MLDDYWRKAVAAVGYFGHAPAYRAALLGYPVILTKPLPPLNRALALDRDPVHQPPPSVVIVDRVVLDRAVVPERQRPRLPTENRPAFREAFQRRRCIVPVDNFYEWKKTATGKQPYAVALADRGLMALGGLWENWRSPAGAWVRSFVIVTTEPNALCAELHKRMPVVLGPETWRAWLGEEPADAGQLKAVLAPYRRLATGAWRMCAGGNRARTNRPTPPRSRDD